MSRGLEGVARASGSAERGPRLQPELLEDHGGGTETGEGRLDHVQAREGAEQGPPGADEVGQRQTGEDHEATQDWPWSSAQVHLGRVADDGVTAKAPVLSRYPDFAGLIAAGEDDVLSQRLRRAEAVGRPLGGEAFITRLEAESGRALKPGKRGRRPKAAGE